jgi:hypothetical protein
MAVLFVFLSLHKPAAETKSVEPVKIEIAQPAYIEGTDVTYKQLEELLPFGNAIFYYSENKRFTYQVFKNGLVDWQIDWDNVKIEPDFVAGTVKWTIPAPISIVGTNINIQMKGNSAAVGVIPFKRDKIFSAGLLYDSPNKPTLWIGTLSDDQRSPVFVIGFRIESERERGQKKQ